MNAGGSRSRASHLESPPAEQESRLFVRWSPAFRCTVMFRERASDRSVAIGRVVDLSDRGARVVIESGEFAFGAPWIAEFDLADRKVLRSVRGIWQHEIGGATHLGLAFVAESADATPALRLGLDRVDIDPRDALRIPTAIALRRRVLPLCEVGGRIVVACADLADRSGLEIVARTFDKPLEPQLVDAEELTRTIQRIHGDPRLAAQAVDSDVVGQASQVDQFMYAAWLRRASDIHVIPERDGVHVLLRVDGQLEPYRVMPADSHAELLSRIKILGGMDIAERRAPQDGRFTHDLPGDRRVDVRVATLPTNHGERATLRLLAIDSDTLTLERLGMSVADLERCARGFRQPHGLILATGPTGCGKTTTLFAALREITSAKRVNAIALQEPVEYDIPGITQVEIDGSQKMTFGSALRSIMRHDPDVIMVGEIRDAETASIAIKAALTGHLVFATLHTNSAASVVTRLIDMGVERYLLAATLRLVIAQRLVRRLCPECRNREAMGRDVAAIFGRADDAPYSLYQPVGCVFCAGRGFRGRLGIFEVLEIDRELKDALRDGAQEGQLEDRARQKGMPSLRDDAFAKVIAGSTALIPALEVTELAEFVHDLREVTRA